MATETEYAFVGQSGLFVEFYTKFLKDVRHNKVVWCLVFTCMEDPEKNNATLIGKNCLNYKNGLS